MDDDRDNRFVEWGRRLGAMEGTGLGLVAAGAVMAMAWLGQQFGSVATINEGRWAALFVVVGAVILLWSMRPGRDDPPQP